MDKERRAKSRYPLQLNVRYQTMGMAGPVAGIGETTNVSSSGVFVTSTTSIREGSRVRVVIEWPSLLNGTTPLQLITIGTVVRRQDSGFAIAFEGYQFRTAGRRATVATMPDPRVSPSANYGSAGVTNLPLLAKSF
ncbi:MAG TPA: PilZ domain-containing protein [Bryobacteraceae bacterium]|nr:PilZ domain-containing protein [Bryobacteraceae bacterium]